jgi:hypothetical protein
MVMSGEDMKVLYENLDELAHVAGGSDIVQAVVIDLLGLVYQRERARTPAHWALDPDNQADAARVARRWLKDRGVM